jgi:uncharacterized protein YjbI with pentapeptide repeats
LRDHNFEKADCYRTDFRNSIFEGLNMRAAKFKHCDFTGANLRNTIQILQAQISKDVTYQKQTLLVLY